MKIIRIASVLLAVCLALGALAACSPSESGNKKATVTVSVTHADASVKEVTFETEPKTLREVLIEQQLISADETGLIRTVDGEYADLSVGTYWQIKKDGEPLPESADTLIVQDGDHFEILFMVQKTK